MTEIEHKAMLAAATRMRDACLWGGPAEDWLPEANVIFREDFAPITAAREDAAFQAGAEAMREAAAHEASLFGQGKAGMRASAIIVERIRALPIPARKATP